MNIEFGISRKQKQFIEATQSEVLFGGAAGGGKSYGQIIDAYVFALRYAGSKQLMLRRTFPELERSLIRTSLELYNRELAKYTDKKWTFVNGSIIEFGYCDTDRDVIQYQSAEYDVIRFDELTHFTEYQYTYLISRIRGANNFPKQIKSSTNPGGVGHTWVKKRFIDPAPANTEFKTFNDKGKEIGTGIFIPSFVQDNTFLMKADPDYINRLEQQNENDKRALLYGEWELDFGQYFNELEYNVHIKPRFELKDTDRIYVAMDYGLDCFACYWIAYHIDGTAQIYKEIHESDLIVSEAAKRLKEVNGDDKVFLYLAPDDLFSRDNTSGKSPADIFGENGIHLTAVQRKRIPGWYALKEWLKPITQRDVITGEEYKTAKLTIVEGQAPNLWKSLTSVLRDEKEPNDVANKPHNLTHGPDAIRNFATYWTNPQTITKTINMKHWTDDMKEDYAKANAEDKKLLLKLWGGE